MTARWLRAERVHREPLHARVEEEISDVLLYLIWLGDVLDVDLAPGRDAEDGVILGKQVPGQEPTRYILGAEG